MLLKLFYRDIIDIIANACMCTFQNILEARASVFFLSKTSAYLREPRRCLASLQPFVFVSRFLTMSCQVLWYPARYDAAGSTNLGPSKALANGWYSTVARTSLTRIDQSTVVRIRSKTNINYETGTCLHHELQENLVQLNKAVYGESVKVKNLGFIVSRQHAVYGDELHYLHIGLLREILDDRRVKKVLSFLVKLISRADSSFQLDRHHEVCQIT